MNETERLILENQLIMLKKLKSNSYHDGLGLQIERVEKALAPANSEFDFKDTIKEEKFRP